ncbi:MAG TPA: hypothetical protein DCG39_07910 [Opitutae bacterium]|nr:hypothetical protein [Opitutae bacterium]
MEREKIRNLQVEKDRDGNIARVGCYFGMGHFLEVRADENGNTVFCFGETHHGIDASEQVLADLIFELRDNPCSEESLPRLGKAVQEARLSGGVIHEAPNGFQKA